MATIFYILEVVVVADEWVPAGKLQKPPIVIVGNFKRGGGL